MIGEKGCSLQAIAQLQEQWVSEPIEVREKYQRLAIDANKQSLATVPSFGELPELMQAQHEEQDQALQHVTNSAYRVFKITQCGKKRQREERLEIPSKPRRSKRKVQIDPIVAAAAQAAIAELNQNQPLHKRQNRQVEKA